MLKQAKNIFFVGIKGVAMANLAVFLKKMKKNVFGADLDEEFITDKLLIKNKINFQVGFEKLPKNIDLVVYSAAHGGLKNPLVIKAKKRNIKIISQAELLGQLMTNFNNKIAISGCHGKTTTSSLLSYALNKLKAKPSYIVGVPYFSFYQGSDYQEKKYFIVEADEYGINPPFDKTPKFLKLNPDWIICTNIDFDHPDVYQDIKETKKAFINFFTDKKLILNIDDQNLKDVFNLIKNKNKNITTYGFSKEADYQITGDFINENFSQFKIKNIGDFKISLFGRHNISNTTAVIIQLLKLGFKIDEIKKSITDFTGAKRRFELVYKKDNIYLFDDYAHHPKEIEETINAARQRFKNKRIIIIFQPHTYSRTKSLLSQFRVALSSADFSLILPIFASARENKMDFKISSKDIVKNKRNLIYVQSTPQLTTQLKSMIKKEDVILTMGAGDVYKLKDEIIKIINDKLQITNSK